MSFKLRSLIDINLNCFTETQNKKKRIQLKNALFLILLRNATN